MLRAVKVKGLTMGGSQILTQEGGYACANASSVDDHPAAAPKVFEEVDKAGENLRVGLPRPPVVLHHAKGGELGPETVVKVEEFSDGDDGGVLLGPDGPEPDIFGLFGLAGKVNAGDVGAPVKGRANSGMLATEQS